MSELGAIVAIGLEGLHDRICKVGNARAQFAWKQCIFKDEWMPIGNGEVVHACFFVHVIFQVQKVWFTSWVEHGGLKKSLHLLPFDVALVEFQVDN